MTMDKIKQLQEILQNSKNIVFFGGAGVSTESGIPDFRSADGLYHQKYDYPPEQILSHDFFFDKTKEFYKFYFDKMLDLSIKPNAAHKQLAKWEKLGKVKAIVTQNIDGLHQLAGSKMVYELHGTVHKNRCTKCNKFYSAEDIIKFKGKGIPTCSCGGIIKPEVVLYNEGLDGATINGAVQAIANADTLIVAGTSLTVYPAAGLIDYFRGKHLILINRDKTGRDVQAEIVIHEPVGETLAKINLK
ncbi:MAG: NAD-dependent protein deacylase [Mycoplasma sp.]|nr:NAD-dependent protein deacylase [Candidatus Hennigella equi]